MNLSADVLIQDTFEVLSYVRTKYPERSIIILGHAMGGAIATKTLRQIDAEMGESELQKSIQALFVIDITDGIAKDALPHMEEVIGNRPTFFPDQLSVVRYTVMSKIVRNKHSAAVSAPDLVVQTQDPLSGEQKYVWRTDLSATVPFWDQWFSEFNAIYLGLTTRKWLMLSDMGNLDNELYGQAEAGKFTPAGIPNVGHFMHEDSPDKFAQAVLGSL